MLQALHDVRERKRLGRGRQGSRVAHKTEANMKCAPVRIMTSKTKLWLNQTVIMIITHKSD